MNNINNTPNLITKGVIGLVALFVILPMTAQALPTIPRIGHPGGYFSKGPSLYIGYNQGGDALRGGSDGDELNAGDGISYHLGMNMDFSVGGGHRVAVQIAGGYRSAETDFDNTNSSKGTGEMSVYPVDVLVYYQIRWLKFGGGISYHFLPSYTETYQTGSSREIEFNNQLGYTIAAELGGMNHQPFFVGLRYTMIEYEPKDGAYVNLDTGESFPKVDGSYVGIYVGLHL